MFKTIMFGTLPGSGRKAIDGALVSIEHFLEARPWIRRCVIHAGSDEVPRNDPANADGVNAAMEIWSNEDRDVAPDETPFSCFAVYRVEEILEKGSMDWPKGSVPGFTLISRNYPKAGASAEEVRAGYDRHPPLARRIHVGMAAYTRNWIKTRVPGDAEPFSSVSVLHFENLDDLVNRLYLTQEDRQSILEDAGNFMQPEKSFSLRAVCHVLN